MKWGKTWGKLWGSGAARETWEQGGWDVDAKQDTVFLGKSSDGTLSELADDRSQEDTDFTVGTDSIYENPSTRCNLQAPWTVEFLIDAGSGDSGTLWEYYPGGYKYQRLRLASSVLTLTIDAEFGGSGGVTTVTLSGLNLTSSPRDRIVVGVSAEPNQDTAGDSDAVRYTLVAHNLTKGTYHQASATGYDTDTSNDQCTFLARDGLGADEWPGPCYAIRFSKTAHSTTETDEDLGPRSAPLSSRSGETRIEELAADQASGVGDDGQFAGPVHAVTAAALRQEDLRLVGPVVNEVYYDTTYTYDNGDDTPIMPWRWWRLAPRSSTLWMGLPFLQWRPVPAGANKVRVRVSGIWDANVTVACYSMSRRPGPLQIAGGAVPPMVVHSVQATNTTPTYIGWIDLGWLDVARDHSGLGSYFALAFKGTGTSDHFRVRAWTADAGVVNTSGGQSGPGGP